MHGAVHRMGDVGDRHVVQVAKRQRRPMLRGERLQRLVGLQRVERRVPRVARLIPGGITGDRAEAALLAGQPPPVIDELVPGDADEPPGR